jgi:ribonuclease HI
MAHIRELFEDKSQDSKRMKLDEKEEEELKQEPTYVLFFDGAAKNNPGPAAGGWCFMKDDEEIAFGWSYLGDKHTNNEAEYQGVIHALESFHTLNKTIQGMVDVRGDSRLVIEHVNGRWKCKAPNLLPLLAQVRKLVKKNPDVDFRFIHIPRNENRRADKYANKGVSLKHDCFESFVSFV